MVPQDLQVNQLQQLVHALTVMLKQQQYQAQPLALIILK
jgi:hypothetical protein